MPYKVGNFYGSCEKYQPLPNFTESSTFEPNGMENIYIR